MIEQGAFPTPKREIISQTYERAIKDKKKNAFLVGVSQEFPLEENPELHLSALAISHMRETSFEEKWHTFVLSMWYSAYPDSSDMFGLSQTEVSESLVSAEKSELISIMSDVATTVIDSYREEGYCRLPIRYDVKMMHRKALVEKYLGVLEDGTKLGYKQIAGLMTEELRERITVQNVNHIVRQLRAEGRAERRMLSREQVAELKLKVKELRVSTDKTVRLIAEDLNQPMARIENVLAHLIREGEVANKNPKTDIAKFFLPVDK